MHNRKYLRLMCKKNNLKLIIKEDGVGYYLIVYKNVSSEKSSEDYLLDTLDHAFEEARLRYGITKTQWSFQEDK